MKDLGIAILCSLSMGFMLLFMVALLGCQASAHAERIRELEDLAQTMQSTQHEMIKILNKVTGGSE